MLQAGQKKTNSHTYNSLLATCADGSKTETALEVLIPMRQIGKGASVITYRSTITTCAKVGKMGTALEVLKQMRQATQTHYLQFVDHRLRTGKQDSDSGFGGLFDAAGLGEAEGYNRLREWR